MGEKETEHNFGDDAELFKEATTGEAPANAGGAEQGDEQQERQEPAAKAKGDEARDPGTGQFVKKRDGSEQPAKADGERPGQGQQQEQQQQEQRPAVQHHVPLAEHLSEREKRQAAEAQLNETRRAMADLQRQFQQAQQPKRDPIDVLDDPNGFRNELQDTFNGRIRNLELKTSLRLAHIAHRDGFEKAYEAFCEADERGDVQTCRQLVNSPDPGEAIVRWYQNNQVLKEVGNDPAAYRQRILDQALEDETFLARAVEKIKGGGQQQQRQNGNGQARPLNTTVRIPSLNRATSAATPPGGSDDVPQDDKGLFSDAMRGR